MRRLVDFTSPSVAPSRIHERVYVLAIGELELYAAVLPGEPVACDGHFHG